MYTVRASENSAYIDSESWPVGGFATWETAKAAVTDIVDRSLKELYRPDMEADELFRQYTLFGEDAFITPATEGEAFSAWEYARERCREICDAQRREPDSGV